MNRKIAIFGGTFSPPHVGHVYAAEQFLKHEEPDMLYIIPANIPPHKTVAPGDNPAARLHMARLAFSSLPGYGENVMVSDYELQKGGRSYTIYTIEHFWQESENISILCGTDMMLSLDTWHRCEDIFKYADIVYIRRENDAALSALLLEKSRLYREKYNARIRCIDADPLVISSEQLRAKLASGEDCSAFIPENVLSYIKANKLYGA